MDLLDIDFMPMVKPKPLNWVGKAFYVGEVALIVASFAIMSRFVKIDDDLVPVAWFGFYGIAGFIFVFFSTAFAKKRDKILAAIGLFSFVLMGLEPLRVALDFPYEVYRELRVYLYLAIAVMAGTAFIYFFRCLIKREPHTSPWSYVGMVIRLGLYLIPVTILIMDRVF